MQSTKEDYFVSLDSDFSEWEEYFCSDVQASDVENKLNSENLIREHLIDQNVATAKWKEIRLHAVNTYRDLILQEEQKSTDVFSGNKMTCNRKHPDELSDSEDFCAPNKKRKTNKIKSVHIYVKPDKSFAGKKVPMNLINNNINDISVIEIPLVSGEIVGSQKEVKTARNLTISSQETCSSQNSQISLSPTVITSSQESLGNKIMKIKIEDISLNATSQSGTLIDITPSKNSHVNQNLKSSIHVSKDASFSTKMKAGFLETHKLTKNCGSSVSDSSGIKSGKLYNKEQKRIIQRIHKRELELKKKEDAYEIREKVLQAREADIQKKERFLKAMELKYLSLVKMKNKLQKQGIKTKKSKRISVLEDDRNSFSTNATKRLKKLVK